MSQLLEIAGAALGEVIGHPLVGLVARLLALYLSILWIAAAWWVWRDMRARSRDSLSPYLAASGVVLATPFLFPLAVVVYRIVRPSTTVAERRAASLRLMVMADEVEVPRCEACARPVDESWLRCPACGSQVAERCPACDRPVGLDWDVCAWCTEELGEAPVEVPVAQEADGHGVEEGPAEDTEAGPGVGVRAPVPEPVALPVLPGGRPMVPVMALEAAPPEPGWPALPQPGSGGPDPARADATPLPVLPTLATAARAAMESAIEELQRTEEAVTVDPEPVPWSLDDARGRDGDGRGRPPRTDGRGGSRRGGRGAAIRSAVGELVRRG